MANLVDFLPLLQHIPTAMQKRGKALNTGLVETYGGIIKDIEQKLEDGIPVEDCLAKTMLQNREQDELDDLDMAILASAFMIGGVETVSPPIETIGTILNFLRQQLSCSGSQP